jgi:hypothetical protein
MKNRVLIVLIILLLAIAIFGWNPFAPHRNTADVLTDTYTRMETGIQRQGNGIYVVKALTRMPGVKAQMVRWWFADYMQTTEHYKRWHPTAHVWMGWENKEPGKIVGASHLVHEYIGTEMQKLRIQFIDPTEFLGAFEIQDSRFVICARVGALDEPLNVTTMCHIVRDTPWGAEMRSIFWLGHVAKREGNNQVFSIEGLLGNTALARFILLDVQLARDLMIHAIQEMGYLADFLPELYVDETLASDE